MTGNGFEGTREEMERAIRRLNILEYVIVAVTFLLALAGGGVAAYILSAGTEPPFRLTWAAISLVLLIIPGLLVFGRDFFRRRGPPASSGEEQMHNG